MENASKALIMAGTILISIMVISLGVYIINMFGEYTAEQEQERANQQIAEFNAQFLKYEGRTDITAQDIVTVANLAKENNDLYEFDTTDSTADENTYYVEVKINTSNYRKNNFEKEAEKETFLEDEENIVSKNASDEVEGLKYYTCRPGAVEISSVTKRVYRITFTD